MSASRPTPLTCSGHTRPVVHLTFSELQQDNTYLLVSSCKDGNPMLREWTGDWIGTFIGHKGAVWSTKLSADASKAATGSADFTAKIWDTHTGQPLHSFSHNHIVRTVALSRDASYLLTSGHEKKIRLFDLNRPDAEPSFIGAQAGGKAHDGTIKSILWVGELAGVSAGDDGLVKWWDLRSGEMTHSVDFGSPITSLEMSTPSSTLTITSGRKVSFVPFLHGSAPTHTLTLTYAPSSASLYPVSPDRFITGSMDDPWVRLHTLDGTEKEVLKAHHGPVHCVEFSPDGELYASGSEDGTIRLWQTTPGKSYGLWQGVSNGN